MPKREADYVKKCLIGFSVTPEIKDWFENKKTQGYNLSTVACQIFQGAILREKRTGSYMPAEIIDGEGKM